MDRVSYAGEMFFTGSDIAHALLDYAQALSQVHTSATVEIPTIDSDGTHGSAELLIGPASQVMSSRVATTMSEPEDVELVARLHHRAAALREEVAPVGSVIVEEPTSSLYVDDYGL